MNSKQTEHGGTTVRVGQAYDYKFTNRPHSITVLAVGTMLTSRTALRPFKTILTVENSLGQRYSMDLSTLRSNYRLRRTSQHSR